MSNYKNELMCGHGIGHGPHVHSCDGCCASLIEAGEAKAEARIIKLLEEFENKTTWHFKELYAAIKGETK